MEHSRDAYFLPLPIGSTDITRNSWKRRTAALIAQLVPQHIGDALLPGSVADRVYAGEGMIAFQKIAADNRPWNWYEDF
jgi:hypothetical protein